MKKLITITLAMLAIAVAGCTQNQRAKSFGGTAELTLPPGRKLVNVTFKQDDLWFLTRAAKEGEKPETYYFIEESSWGLLQGEVVIRER